MERTRSSLLRPLKTGPEWIMSLSSQQENSKEAQRGSKECNVCNVPIMNQLERRTCKVCGSSACRLCTALVHLVSHRRRKYVCFRCLKVATSTLSDSPNGSGEDASSGNSEDTVLQRLSERAANGEAGEQGFFNRLWSTWSAWMEVEPESEDESDFDTMTPSRHVRNSSKRMLHPTDSTASEGMFDGFEMARLLQESLNPTSNAVNVLLFVEACSQIVKFTAVLGKAFEFVVVDLNHKVEIVQRRTDEYVEAKGVDRASVTVQELVEYDIERKMTHAGKKAAPASRNILRLLWFVDFVRCLLRSLAEDYSANLKKTCSIVYESVLAQHHDFIMRRVVKMGLGMVPDRSKLRDRAGLMGMTPAQESETLVQWAQPADEVSMVLWSFMESKKLKKLP